MLIDDLVSKGTEEPYRMFTSRAEFRTLLRQDNADLRLTELGYRLGLASDQRMQKVQQKASDVRQIKSILADFTVEPEQSVDYLAAIDSAPLNQKQKAQQLLLRPDVNLSSLAQSIPTLASQLATYPEDTMEQAEIQIKYDTYIRKEKELVERMTSLEDLRIPESFNYERIGALSTEALQKLKKIKPSTLGQASRISGVNPSDLQILLVYMGR